MLNMVNLSVKRGHKAVLDDFNLSLVPGSGHGLVGANGSGKTTLLLAALDLLAYEGSITRSYSPNELGVVWQDRALPLNTTSDRWLKYLAALFQSPIDNALFERFNIENTKIPIRSMSGGEMQKLAIVSAFFHNPKLLILDEPTVGLDEASRMEFHTLCRERISNGASILVTSHQNSDILAITSKITHMSQSHEGLRFLFSTSRPLSDAELSSLKSENIFSTITETENGYVVQSNESAFQYLAEFALKNNLKITSYADLS